MVVGIDEVGRGAWAGPVVAGGVVFAPETKIPKGVTINDSKQLTSPQREKAASWIRQNSLAWGIGEAPVSVINRVGMGKATKMAFRRAISQLADKSVKSIKPDFLLIDAFYIPYVRGLRRKNQKAIINGDEKSISIAAASILAKVYRDALMHKLSERYRLYKWGNNKGYGTKKHQSAIKKYGLTRFHRKAFVATWKERIRGTP